MNIDNKRENEKAAQDHISNNKLNSLFKELINTVVHDQPIEPIQYMIKHLRTLISKDDPDLKDIEVDLTDFHPNFKPIIKDFGFPKGTTSKISEILTKRLFDSLLGIKTNLGGQISHILNTAIKMGLNEEIGLYLTDPDAYNAFKPLVNAAYQRINKFDVNNSLYDLNRTNEIFSLKYCEKIREKISFFRIRYSRNISNLPFLPYAREHSQKLIKEKLMKAINEIETGGADFYPYSDKNEDNNFKILINKFYDFEQNIISHGVNKHCGIIIPNLQSQGIKYPVEYAYLINFNDHLQIVSYNSNPKNDFRKCFEILDDKLKQISDKVMFENNKEFGFTSSCVSNTGEALKITSGLNLPLLSKNGNFVFLLTEWDISHKYQTKPENIVQNEIIAKHRNGVDKNVFINSYIVKICSLINFENKLSEDVNYKFPQISENYLSKKMLSIYNSQSRSLRYIVTPNNKGFNSIFRMQKISKRFNLCFQDKESYIIYKNFISDYIAEKTNVSMNLNKEELENKNIKRIINEGISEKNLEDLVEQLKIHSTEKLNKVYFIQRMNLKKFNFFNSLPSEKTEELKNFFLKLTQEISKTVPGKLQVDDGLDVLYNSSFNIVFEELKEYSSSSNRNLMAFLTMDNSILVLFNGEDHIKIILSIESYENLSEEFSYFNKIIDILKPNCSFDEYFGYLTTNPVNSGSGFEIRMNFNSKDNKYLEELKPEIKKFMLSKSLSFSNNFEIFNKVKASFHGNEIIANVARFLKAITPEKIEQEVLGKPHEEILNKVKKDFEENEVEVDTKAK